eukprot:3425929-Amphidinium_carterae.1
MCGGALPLGRWSPICHATKLTCREDAIVHSQIESGSALAWNKLQLPPRYNFRRGRISKRIGLISVIFLI